MNLLLNGTIAVDHEPVLRSLMPAAWQVSLWDPRKQSPQEIVPLLHDADVIIGGNLPLATWPAIPALKLVQIPWAGYNFTSPEKMPLGIPVANCYEHETAIAEYVLLAMLEWQIGLQKMDARFRRSGWDGKYPAGGIFHGEIRGQSVGIVGFGHIGEEVAKRAKAFDMEVLAIRRSVPQKTPENVDWMGSPDQLTHLLERSDYVLLACDLNEQTENMINGETLARMKSSAVLINVARGEVVDEADLYAALVAKEIGGAVLDVWYNYNQLGEPEVWPSNKPFQELDNVILSAHECCWTREQDRRRWQTVVDNVKRVSLGEQPVNVVFTGAAAHD